MEVEEELERVWVRHEYLVRSFEVQMKNKRRKVMVQEIADYWQLGELSIGQQPLSKDRSGMDLEEMQEIAMESRLGDGKSRETPIEIEERTYLTDTRKPVPFAERKRRRGRSLCDRMAKQNPRASGKERERLEIASRRASARRECLYGPGSTYEYSSRLCTLKIRKAEDFEERLFAEVKAFVGTLHVLSPGEELGDGNCAGMVTLWSVTGACFTAYNCVKDHLAGSETEKLFFVRLPHLQPGETVTYECKVEVQGFEPWALLEPVERKAFGVCMSLGFVAQAPLDVYTFSLEDGDLKHVRAGSIQSKDRFQSILPTSRMVHTVLGAPVFYDDGKLCGIVTCCTDLDEQPEFKLHPSEGKIKYAELERLVRSSELLAGKALYKDLLEGLKTKQLVNATWTKKRLIRAADQWNLDHPFEEFS